MFEKAARVLAEVLNIDPSDVSQDMPLRGANGMSDEEFARLLIGCERVFKLTIYDIDAVSFRIFGDLVAYLKDNGRKLDEKSSARDGEMFDYDEYFYSE